MRWLFPAVLLLLSCNQSDKAQTQDIASVPEKTEQQNVPASSDLKQDPQPVSDSLSSKGLTPLSEEDKDYISLQEDSRFYRDAKKQFEKLSPKYLGQLYGQEPASADELHLLMRRQLVEQRKKAGRKIVRPYLPAAWEAPESLQINTESADLLYVYGDIDNLGYGWPASYDPFSGESTKPHDYPFVAEPDDPSGTDRIMVNSGYQYPAKENNFQRERSDGYTTSTRRPDNLPETLRLRPTITDLEIRQVLLQLFVDDFQAPSFSSQFQFYLNGKEIPSASTILNDLKQGGPIGKLISIVVLPEYFDEIRKGKLDLFIDSPASVKGDGFAIDFVRLLINPKNLPRSNVRGKVTDAKTRKPLPDTWIKVSGASEVKTNEKGEYQIDQVPCGLVLVQAAKAGYKSNHASVDLIQKKTSVANIKLEPETDKGLQEQLDEKGKIELYGIYFDSDKASIKPGSLPTLQQLAELIRKNPNQSLEIGGHTDSEGDANYNSTLSKQRADAVLAWLKNEKVPVSQLKTRGYGESEPVADNQTETGRALNRRVEIKQTNQ